jgi:hypothetical protein
MSAMKVREFMELLEERTLAMLSDRLREACTSRVRSVWFQVHFDSPKVHYEVCLTRKTERIEMGLHFEGPHDFSYLWAERLAEHMVEIYGKLGPEWELEEWTASWTRLHTTIPYDPLSPALAEAIAERMADLISTCQPIIERERENIPMGLETVAPAKVAARRRWKR